jgi:hypothetical protein
VEPENKLAVIDVPTIDDEIHKKLYRSGFSSIFIAKQDVSPVYFGYKSESSMRQIINLKASQLHESGISSYILKKSENFKKEFKPKPSKVGPQVLTMQHLSAGFVVFWVCLGISAVVFSAEFLWKKVKDVATFASVVSVVAEFVKSKMFE